MTTVDSLVPDSLWRAIQPLLPTPPPRYGGRPRVDDRAALAAIVYQLRTGVPWRLLPSRQLGCGSPVTCWRRLRDWQRAGVWRQLHHLLLEQLSREGRLDWSRASLDSLSVRQTGGELTGPNPTDRGKPGSKYHLLVDRDGVPLAVGLSAANTHDSMLLEPMVDAVPAVKGPRGRPGRPRKRPAKLHGDKGLRLSALPAGAAPARDRPADRPAWHRAEQQARPPPVCGGAVAGVAGGSRRLQVRYERRGDILLGFLELACALICLNCLKRWQA
jgi:transposase